MNDNTRVAGNIIHTQVTLNGDTDMNLDEEPEYTMENVLDDRFDNFLMLTSEDGLNTTRDTYFNGMQALVEILNAVYDESDPAVSIMDALTLVEEALENKATEGEIDLSYSANAEDEDADVDGLFDEGDEDADADKLPDLFDEDEDDDDSFEDQ